MDRQHTDDVRAVLAEALSSRTYSHAQEVDESVAAVVTVEDDLRFLPATLAALFAQSVLPGTIVVADCTGGTAQPVETSFEVIASSAAPMTHLPQPTSVSVQLVRAQGARSFGSAVAKGLQYARLDGKVRSLWLLHDDSRPADGQCLEHLVEAWRASPTAALLGGKQLDWDGRTLHDVGAYAAGHRIETLVVDGEPDQEQYDSRADVYAVSLAGALVPLQTWQALGGTNDWYGSWAESSDLCRRICNGGGRVVVVPAARIAHRRARFEAIRSRNGREMGVENTKNPAMPVFIAWQRYWFTDIPMGLWPLMWVWRVIRGLGMAVVQLVGKRPYEAWCELCVPWHALFSWPRGIPARRAVARRGSLPRSQLAMLSAGREQLAQWRDRRDAFAQQRGTVLLSPLVQRHLRVRVVRRWSLAILMALVCAGAFATLEWGVLREVMAGGSLMSAIMPSTGASFRQLVQAATTQWAFGSGVGVAAPPAPWLMVLMAASVVTLGNVAAAMTMILCLAAPLSALSFWALAGIFTRSDAVRVTCGMLWCALSFALGLFQTANLPMLTVMTFLPAAFAFVFRAVGMYHTEDPIHPRPSVQASAAASLCFMPVVAAEPQLLLPLVLVFLAFLIFVPRHRAMLLLMPVPAALLAAPSLVDAVRRFESGAWRQLFGDMTVPRLADNGSPEALSLADVGLRAFGFDMADGWSAFTGKPLAFLALAICTLIALLALVSLVLPFALRASRMMWVVAVAGGMLALASARVAIAPADDGSAGTAVAGSVLPGFALLMLGLLSCVCLMAGGAVRRFVPLGRPGHESAVASVSPRRWLIVSARSLLVVVLFACALTWTGFGVTHGTSAPLSASTSGLPMVASDLLEDDENQRILALKATSESSVSYEVMRTSRGELIDSSPAIRARQVSGTIDDPANATLSAASARLLATADADAVAAISALGINGIFVVTGDDADEQLVSNIAAADGTQAVVTNDSGAYFRLTVAQEQTNAIDPAGRERLEASPLRATWLGCLAVVAVMYCLVAIPHRRRMELEG